VLNVSLVDQINKHQFCVWATHIYNIKIKEMLATHILTHIFQHNWLKFTSKRVCWKVSVKMYVANISLKIIRPYITFITTVFILNLFYKSVNSPYKRR